ncbi:branched-chain amino acid ABC transporter permease [Elioraea tepida]|uniref:Branched-chain amino acid ABC transporter permease n=1 Tax=Elioraea tepida TaxID=2843330 RepID=A0A975U267_9PROT|nr:branched-chain amino acid ABC transporter permease [Elioraea tepida]QXM24885.1 branched-chain amino acid ABC transporter permease [Elioraea tepida]
MTALLFVEQTLNGLQLGVMLFMIAAGLTLIFGIMDVINLAHGSLYMAGAFVGATVTARTGSFALGVLAGAAAGALIALLLELAVIRRLYARDHLDQVLATYALILTFNEAVKVLWGPAPIFLAAPPLLSGTVEVLPGIPYPAYRLAVIAVGLAAALFLGWLIGRTRLGMLIRAGTTNRETVQALGVDIGLLFALVFALGGALAGLAGVMAGPVLAVQVGMGEQILILAFVVIVVGGLGSVRGAMAGSLLVGLADTWARALLPVLLRGLLPPAAADQVAANLGSVAVYLLMAVVLSVRPQGLFPRHA